jgi:glutamate-5-semialdehyde dehydrogenase
LIHESCIATGDLEKIALALLAAGVTLKVDKRTREVLAHSKDLALRYDEDRIQDAVEEDFYTEFLDLTIAIKVVNSVDEAITHINEHGSKHTDCIITENKETAEYFMTRVDAAGCYWNASTRFADGFRYGFGAEVGVSTNKTHARGPVGLEGLVIYKYKLFGHGERAADYGSGKKQYKHETIDPAQYKV